MLELMAVITIVTILSSMVLPVMFKARHKARESQCTNNLRQLGIALAFYDDEHERLMENYPDRLTHLYKLGYQPDLRLFVCPMDYTKALPNTYGNTLKPGTPNNTMKEWAERTTSYDSTDLDQQNCSYLYEFNTRPCQQYTIDGNGDARWNPEGNFCSEGLVYWDDIGAHKFPSNDDMDMFPYLQEDLNAEIPKIDRDQSGTITWQEAKIWQRDNGDLYLNIYDTEEIDYPTWIPTAPVGLEDPIDSFDYEPKPGGYPHTWLPIVRCFWHVNPEDIDSEKVEGVLNLAVGGNTFYSRPFWERTAWEHGFKPPDP